MNLDRIGGYISILISIKLNFIISDFIWVFQSWCFSIKISRKLKMGFSNQPCAPRFENEEWTKQAWVGLKALPMSSGHLSR